MKQTLVFSMFVLVFASYNVYVDTRGVNGGTNCAVCTVVAGMVQQTAYLKEISIFEASKRLCKQLPNSIEYVCYDFFNELEPLLVNKNFLTLYTPDLFCYAINSCHVDPGENFCHIFPKPHISVYKSHKKLVELLIKYKYFEIINKFSKSKIKVNPECKNNDLCSSNSTIFTKTNPMNFYTNFCDLPVIKSICEIMEGNFENLTPLLDFDNDGFSIFKNARGSNWRGKDCNDVNSFIYPGAQTINSDISIDGNCNGIWGKDKISGRPWEELLCDGTESKGLIYLGDSIGAHFTFPRMWIDPTLHDTSNITVKISAILDELDWPEFSFSTGYSNLSYPDIMQRVTSSIYLRLRANNLCSHRDYQNNAKNAATSFHGSIEAETISRQPSDKPVVVLYAMMGNDVCNRFRNTIENMTEPGKFKELVLETLRILDRKLPLNSDVVLTSLLDASYIYSAMAERIHPLGSVLKNIKYKDVYSWFSCMQIGPCEGWMTPNTTLQKITSQKSHELSMVLKYISETYTFISFKVHFITNPLNQVIKNWVAKGRQIYKLIDPVDSTHPNQKSQPLLADAFWKALVKLQVIGPENPNNKKILDIFGDQGGH